MPPSTTTHDLPNFSDESLVLEARRVHRALATDLVLYWSTNIDPGELINRCPAFVHAPGFLSHVEVIADDEQVSVSDPNELRELLRNRSLVRFNVADWSVSWIAGVENEPAQIQAVVGKLPNVMGDMIKYSVYGYPSKRVVEFIEEVRATG